MAMGGRSLKSINDLNRRIHAVERAQTSNVLELFRIAELDLSRDLRFSDWSNLSFKNCDVTGCDFTGARMSACDFTGAKIADARFDLAEIKREQLRKASDWERHIELWRSTKRKYRNDAHLPVQAVFSDAPWAPEMVVVPTGQFLMGSELAETDRCGLAQEYAGWEQPRHQVRIYNQIAIARFPTTFEEYEVYCRQTGQQYPDDAGWGRKRQPVINVSRQDAIDYCEWLSTALDINYRLPSEAEWEFGCRAGSNSAYSFGDKIDREEANFLDGTRDRTASQTIPVDGLHGSRNAFGLYQMHGNLWEWCLDAFEDNYFQRRTQLPHITSTAFIDRNSEALRPAEQLQDNRTYSTDPAGTVPLDYVVRGGSWFDPPELLRSAKRMAANSSSRERIIGFRVVREMS